MSQGVASFADLQAYADDSLESDFVWSEPTSSDFWGPWLVFFGLVIWGLGLVAGFKFSLTILVAAGLGLALMGTVRPILGLFGVTIICTLDALMRTYLMSGGLLRWNTFNYELLFFMLLAAPLLLRIRDYQSGWLRLLILLLAFELYMSPSFMEGVNHLLNLIAVVGLQIFFLRAYDDENAYYWVGMLSGTLAAAGGFIFFLQRGGLERIDENAFSYFPLSGIFGICLAMPHAVENRRGIKTLMLLAVVCAGWLLLIGSRGGMLVGTICLVYLVLNIPGQSQKSMIISLAVLVLLGVTSQFSDMREKAFGRVSKMFDSEGTAASRTSGRSDLMLGAWWIFCEHPHGVGTGGFPKHWAKISEERASELSGYKRGEEQTCHSAWMKTLAENGIPGFVLLFAYVTSFARVGWQMRYRGLFLIGLLTTLCLAFAFTNTEFNGKGLWLLAAGTTVLFDDRTRLNDEDDE